MTSEASSPKPDITGRSDIETLVNHFYHRVRCDELIGFIFEDVAKTNWEAHLPRMYAFWETVLFGTGGFTGNPLAVHARLVPQTEMGRTQFDRWLTLFRTSVDELFSGEKADHIKRCAEDMANVIYSRINQVPDPRFDPAKLTAEQRERYTRFRVPAAAVVIACGTWMLACAVFGQDASEVKKVPQPIAEAPASAAPARQDAAVAAARERAKLLHDVYSTTLDVMHHRYFRQDTVVVPARAMEDVFEEMARSSGGTANWISVNTKAMSINHEPTTAFEKTAAAQLSAGKDEYEQVGKRVYRRAAPIALRTSCVGCHTNMFSDSSTSSRVAGLVISIPLKAEEK